ncbi:MAG TPA: amidohydrolase family protein [Candidatus Limnocylindrales bacterium]
MSPTVDAHHHFWDPTRATYPFLTDDLAAIRRPFGPEDLRPLVEANGIARTILVQTRSDLGETREFLATAAETAFIGGVVGWVDLAAADVADSIEALRAGPGGGKLVGIRHQVHDEPDPEWLARPGIRRGIEAVGAAGLVYDLLVRPREMPVALATVRALPGVRFVIDHLAKPPIASGAVAPWAELLRPFGAEPNVWGKVSGLVTEADWAAGTPADLVPYVARAVDTFGPDRLMFGSDWPVCLLAASYEQVIAATRFALGGLDDGALQRVFGATAAAVYGLTLDD